MSGEFDKCGEHPLECGCYTEARKDGTGVTFRCPRHESSKSLGIDRSNDKFFYKGKFFQNEEEFWKFVEDWPFMNTDQQTFFREWEHLGKEIWMNIGLRGQEISNGCLNEILQENFLHLLQKFF